MGAKIIDGAKEALAFARVERAINDWVREDAPTVIKMAMTPALSRKLAAKLTGCRVHEST